MFKEKTYQEKKVYLKSYDDVFKACQLTFTELKCNIIVTRRNYFIIRIGSFLYLSGCTIELYLKGYLDGKTEVRVGSKTDFLLLFDHPRRVVKKVFGKIDQFLE